MIHTRLNKYILTCLAGLLALFVMIPYASAVSISTVTTQTPTLTEPAKYTVAVNLGGDLTGLANIAAVDATVAYDGSVLEYISGGTGSLLTGGPFPPVALFNDVAAAPGTTTRNVKAGISIIFPIAAATGNLFNLDFRVLPSASAGITPIEISRIALNETAFVFDSTDPTGSTGGFSVSGSTIDVPPAPVPLPAAFWLMVSGLVGFLGLSKSARPVSRLAYSS